MKKVITSMFVLTLVLAAISNGTDSPKGGNVAKGEGFKIDVPTFDVKVKQGEAQTINIKLQRGESFKQDVTLQFEAAEGISIDPAKKTIKASEGPEVQFTITVPKNAAFGEYKVTVIGTPEIGEPTSVEFNVKVVVPDAGYTVQSNSDKGGSTLKGEGFKIAVPTFGTKIKQGETQSVIISLDRGESFKQDVTLEIKLAKGKGITFEPAKVLVKVSDKSDVQLMITAPENTSIGEYIVSVTGTPTVGEATTTEFKVNVVAP
ncbi:MAG: hypothetical protein A2Y10_10990 [Planctomycetes bacterium GWF2_41_51]|nr:MAG: hypothetical protein A2Y10_10990 [Planctomycetes bacterium GWF2_41_51]HBG28427.1 hypothetical protein [Phycisphaerales bacterium]